MAGSDPFFSPSVKPSRTNKPFKIMGWSNRLIVITPRRIARKGSIIITIEDNFSNIKQPNDLAKKKKQKRT